MTFWQVIHRETYLGSEKILVNNGTSYVLSTAPLNYANASAYCLKKGMQILSLELENKFDAITSMIKSTILNK